MDFSFAALGSDEAFAAIDVNQGAYRKPVMDGGVITGFEATSDLSEILTVKSGGADFIGISSTGLAVEYSDGEFPIDFGMFNHGVLIAPETLIREGPLDVVSHATSLASEDLVGTSGVFNVYELVPTTASSPVFSGIDWTSGRDQTFTVRFKLNTAGKLRMSFNASVSGESVEWIINSSDGTTDTAPADSAVDFTILDYVVTEEPGDWYRADLSFTTNTTDSGSNFYRINPDRTGNNEALIVSAMQMTRSDSFRGYVGGDLTASSVTRTEILYGLSTLVASAVASTGSDGLVLAFDFWAARDWSEQNYIFTTENINDATLRSANSGQLLYTDNGSLFSIAAGSNPVTKGNHTVVAHHMGGSKHLSFDGNTVQTTGAASPEDLSLTTSADSGVMSSKAGGQNMRGGIAKIALFTAEPSDTDLEAWPS